MHASKILKGDLFRQGYTFPSVTYDKRIDPNCSTNVIEKG